MLTGYTARKLHPKMSLQLGSRNGEDLLGCHRVIRQKSFVETEQLRLFIWHRFHVANWASQTSEKDTSRGYIHYMGVSIGVMVVRGIYPRMIENPLGTMLGRLSSSATNQCDTDCVIRDNDLCRRVASKLLMLL